MIPKIPMLGKTFNRWTVIGDLPGRWWLCRCSCGTIKPVLGQPLRSGLNKSCGCTRGDSVSRANISRTQHGLAASSEYTAWKGMLYRCLNPKHRMYRHYGARGITVCDRWIRSFVAFYSDMGPKPNSGYTLERIDNNGNYEPGNCRWATQKEQLANTRRTVFVTINGIRKPLLAWVTESGEPYKLLYRKLHADKTVIWESAKVAAAQAAAAANPKP